MEDILIAPSILSADISNLASDIKSVESAGGDWLHVDIMDGSFVPPITFGANAVKAARKACTLPLDVHLMIVNPDKHIDEFKKAGADYLTIHQETCPNLAASLKAVKDSGIKAGATVNPHTPAETLFPVLELCDLVLIMTVNPGWGGQKFMESCLSKIEVIRNQIERRNLRVRVQVDGGINSDTARLAVNAGADVLVAGSYVFNAPDRSAAIRSLRVR